jgi:hypothetical protein
MPSKASAFESHRANKWMNSSMAEQVFVKHQVKGSSPFSSAAVCKSSHLIMRKQEISQDAFDKQ